MPDLLVTAALSQAVEEAVSRPLGSRGSREAVTESAPAELTLAATAVLAAVPSWWTAQAKAAGLSGRWLDIEQAIDITAPVELPAETSGPQSWGSLTPEQVGAVYVEALSSATRARHGRHYTPPSLAAHLWRLTRKSLELPPANRRLAGLVRDPACGAGALMLPALREHLRASYEVDPALTLAGLPKTTEAPQA